MGNLMWDSIPGPPGSRPEPKGDAQPLSTPGAPILLPAWTTCIQPVEVFYTGTEKIGSQGIICFFFSFFSPPSVCLLGDSTVLTPPLSSSLGQRCKAGVVNVDTEAEDKSRPNRCP